MKKLEYQSPEMEIVKLKGKVALLAGSDNEGEIPPGEDF